MESEARLKFVGHAFCCVSLYLVYPIRRKLNRSEPMSYNYKYVYFSMVSISRLLLTQASQLRQHLRRSISESRDKSAGKCLGMTANITSAKYTRKEDAQQTLQYQ